MSPNWQSRSSFEALIDDLFARTDSDEATPKANPVAIASLEATWEVAADLRALKPERQAPHPKSTTSAYDLDGGENSDSVIDKNKISGELGLRSGALESDIAALKREFAMRNHPDRVPDELRQLATQRMMVANTLIDDYVAKLREAERSLRGVATR